MTGTQFIRGGDLNARLAGALVWSPLLHTLSLCQFFRYLSTEYNLWSTPLNKRPDHLEIFVSPGSTYHSSIPIILVSDIHLKVSPS